MSKIFDDNSQTIGNTPLIRLKYFGYGNILVKIEARNPSFSVKCRVASNMIWDAEKRGILKPGVRLVEPTSGNTGVALAAVAAARGYKLTLIIPENMGLDKHKLLKVLGATLILTDASKGMKAAIEKAEEIVAADPRHNVLLQQFSNPANPKIHEKTTGPEIWQDCNGNIDIFIAGVGTGGTLTGVTQFLKNTQQKNVLTVAVEPAASPIITQALSGQKLMPGEHKIQGIGMGFIPDNLDLNLVDHVETVTDDEAIHASRILMKKEGILAGTSSGAAVFVADKLAQKPENAGKIIVAILPSSGEHYLKNSHC